MLKAYLEYLHSKEIQFSITKCPVASTNLCLVDTKIIHLSNKALGFGSKSCIFSIKVKEEHTKTCRNTMAPIAPAPIQYTEHRW